MKLRVLFDSNILNKLVNCSEQKINIIAEKCELLNCEDLIEELNSMRINKCELFNKIKEILEKFQIETGNIFSFIAYEDIEKIGNTRNNNTHGYVDWNQDERPKVKMMTYKDVEVYSKIHPNTKNKKHENDRQISIVASAYEVDCLVTEDKDYYKHIQNTGLKVMNFEEFLNDLNINL